MSMYLSNSDIAPTTGAEPGEFIDPPEPQLGRGHLGEAEEALLADDRAEGAVAAAEGAEVGAPRV